MNTIDHDLDQFMAEGGFSMPPEVTLDAQANTEADLVPSRKRKTAPDNTANKKPKVQENRAVYVTNLPLDTDKDEIADVFSRAGIIDQGADGKKRIRMYPDDQGNFNGEALIVFFKKESIALAINYQNDYWFRHNNTDHKIYVKEADYSFKHNKDSEQIVSKLTRKDKKASEVNRADLNRKLAEWSDNEEEVKKVFAPKKNKWAKFCIVKHAFTLAELDEDVSAILEIKEDMRDEGEKFGTVTNVTLYDKEEEGIVTIHFREFEAAESFQKAINGKGYGLTSKLEVTIPDDRFKFRKSARGDEDADSSDEEKGEKVTQGSVKRD